MTPPSHGRRIAWASPLSAASSIGRDGVRVAEALAARGAQVELIATDYEWSADTPRQVTSLPITHHAAVDLPRLALDFDHVVVNVGDHFGNHAGAFPLLDSAPCLLVVHDFYLANLFNGWLWWNGSPPHLREEVVTAVYGPEALARARLQARGELDLADEAAHLPMTEWVARRAAGCLAHSGFYTPRLLASCPGPVAVAGLPVASRGVPPLPERVGGGRLTWLTVGVVNPNKCVDRMIEALSASAELRTRVTYRVVGPVTDAERARLEARAAEAGFDGLRLEGAATEAQLKAALEASDVIACLRRPVLEGASGSVVEAMLAGRPTIVADAGCYADLPDDAVVKVGADAPVPELTAALERLAADEPGRRALGARARAAAESRHSLEGYLAVLEPLMDAVARGAPLVGLSRTLGGRLAALGLRRADPSVLRLSGLLDDLFASAAAGVAQAEGGGATQPPKSAAV